MFRWLLQCFRLEVSKGGYVMNGEDDLYIDVFHLYNKIYRPTVHTESLTLHVICA